MAFAHVSLEPSELGPVTSKFVGPDAPDKMKRMAAAGLAPLPPTDMLMALYQIWVENDEHAELAAKTVQGLPDPVLDGALADKTLHPGALDLLGRKFARKETVLEKVVRHPRVDSESLVGIARVCSERVCDILADNQARWLAHPAIVGGLYQNRHCRMSVVHRMIELAEREGVDLGLPAMEEIRLALAESGPVDESRDAMFKAATNTEAAAEAEALALDAFGAADIDDDLELPEFEDGEVMFEGDLPDGDAAGDEQTADQAPDDAAPLTKERRLGQLLKMRPLEKIRTAMLGDKYDRSILIRDSNKIVSMAAIKSPKVRENDAVAYSSNRALSHDVIGYISNRREWIKLYTVKLNLVMNPKTPLARSMTLLAHLNRGDVQKVARSKNIPSALATAAKRKMAARR